MIINIKKIKELKTTSVVVSLIFGVLLSAPTFAESSFTHVHFRIPPGQKEQVLAWYRDVLGSEIRELAAIEGEQLAWFEQGLIATMSNEDGSEYETTSMFDHLGVAVSDLDAAIDRSLALGGTIRRPLTTSAPRNAIVDDPWGGSFELMEFPGRTGIDHIHFFVSDRDQARDWFLTVFGGEVENISDSFHRVAFSDAAFHFSQTADGNSRGTTRETAMEHIGILISDMEEFRANLESAGYQDAIVREGPGLLVLEGPDGLLIEVTTYDLDTK